MKSITIHLPDQQHDRLEKLATRRGVGLNQLFEELITRVLAEIDAETHYRVRAAQGNVEAGLVVLDKLDAHYRN